MSTGILRGGRIAWACLAAIQIGACTKAPNAVHSPAPPPQHVVPPSAATQVVGDSFAVGQPRIILRWQTETESNTFGYYVYRADSAAGPMACINSESPVHGAGTSTVPLKYAYFDLSVAAGRTYYYKLQSKDLDGTTEWIVGGNAPVAGTAKPLTEAELMELRAKGRGYREETR